jgi:hypothetical protein
MRHSVSILDSHYEWLRQDFTVKVVQDKQGEIMNRCFDGWDSRDDKLLNVESSWASKKYLWEKFEEGDSWEDQAALKLEGEAYIHRSICDLRYQNGWGAGMNRQIVVPSTHNGAKIDRLRNMARTTIGTYYPGSWSAEHQIRTRSNQFNNSVGLRTISWLL